MCHINLPNYDDWALDKLVLHYEDDFGDPSLSVVRKEWNYGGTRGISPTIEDKLDEAQYVINALLDYTYKLLYGAP